MNMSQIYTRSSSLALQMRILEKIWKSEEPIKNACVKWENQRRVSKGSRQSSLVHIRLKSENFRRIFARFCNTILKGQFLQWIDRFFFQEHVDFRHFEPHLTLKHKLWFWHRVLRQWTSRKELRVNVKVIDVNSKLSGVVLKSSKN